MATDTHRHRRLKEMTPLCARICPCPFFEATTPGAAPGPPVKTGARVRRFRGCNNQPRTPRHSSCRDCPPSSIISAVAYETKPLELPVCVSERASRAAFGRVRGPPARSRADGGLPAAACHHTTSTRSGPPAAAAGRHWARTRSSKPVQSLCAHTVQGQSGS